MTLGVPVIRFASHTGSKLGNSDSNNWQRIEHLSISFGSSESGHALVTLTVPHTWNDKAGGGAAFRIVFSENDVTKVLATGYYSTAQDDQLIPVSVNAMVQLEPTPFEKTIFVEWRMINGGRAWIGHTGITTLAAILQPDRA